MSSALSAALTTAAKVDSTLRDIEFEASSPRQACTKLWCIDLTQDDANARSSVGKDVRPLPKVFRGWAVSSVVVTDQAFLFWQSRVDAEGDVEPHHELYRWSPLSNKLEKFVLRR